MTPDKFRHAYQHGLAALDAQLARAARELATLAAARPADPDAIAAAVARAQQAAESVGAVVGAAAEAVGEPPPVWGTRDELDATVRRLTERLRAAAFEQRRVRLRAVAGALLAAQVIHPRWRQVVPALDTLRLQAITQVEAAADATEPPELPGSADGSAWLAWAWTLPPDQAGDVLAEVRRTVPALAEVVWEIDPSHWVALAAGWVSDSADIDPSHPVPIAEVVADPPCDSSILLKSDAWIEPEPPTAEPNLDAATLPPPARPKVVITPIVNAPNPPTTPPDKAT